MYVGLVVLGYAMFLLHAAPLLPGPYASELHLCVARAARCGCALARR
jgi:hypothetical protein